MNDVTRNATVDMKLELAVIPVSDVDRAKEYYGKLGWRGRALPVRATADRGPADDHRSYRLFASFHDPDGNGWLFQGITTRLPGRIDSASTNFASSRDLASALRRAEAAHGRHEARTGKHDSNWPDWYAEYMVREQNGQKLPE